MEYGKSPNISADHYLEDEGFSVDYKFKGRSIPQVKIEGAVAEQMSGLMLIHNDLEHSKKWLSKAKDAVSSNNDNHDDGTDVPVLTDDDDLTFQAAKPLLISSLTFYAKAFTSASGRRAQMSRDWLDSEYHDRHDFFMHLRHNMAAHSGDKSPERAESYVLIIPTGKNRLVRLHTNVYQPSMIMSQDETEDFEDLIHHAIVKVRKKYKDKYEFLLEKCLDKSYNYWLKESRMEGPKNIMDIV
jgi:hypothetical protein